jgi:coenzyme F420 hydrogenase subunit beta
MENMPHNTIPSINRRYKFLNEEEIGFKIEKNINFVVHNTLCHGCGTCEAVCPEDAVTMRYSKDQGIYLPSVEESKCNYCSLCVEACSGFELDLTDRPWTDDDIELHPLVGPHVDIYRAYSNNAERRERAASGGVVTEIVDYLISSGKVDGAIVVRMKEDEPLVAEGYIARTSNDLIRSQKSKYCPVPLNTILRDIIHKPDKNRYVFVGLPHHVHGLRLVQRLFPHVFDRIPCVISSFTSHTPSQRATEFILYKNDINIDDVKSIEYRGGGNPGRMRIVAKKGAEYLIPHLHWTYSGHSFPLFFYPVREWLYFDKMSEWADITCGDNWMGGLSEQKGASTVVTRSHFADQIIKEMIAVGKIESRQITPGDLVIDQDLNKKLNIGIRLKCWKLLNRSIPVYNRYFQKSLNGYFRTMRFAMNVLISEKKLPYWMMNIIIMADYYLRSIPMARGRKIIRLMKSGFSIFRIESSKPPGRSAKYKVVMIGGYGYQDIGDEAMPHAIRINLRRDIGQDLDLVMLSYNPGLTHETHGEVSRHDFTYISHAQNASIKRKVLTICMTAILIFAAFLETLGIRLRLWPSAREALTEIATADAILNVGGGNINSIIPSELYKKCTTYLIATILGKPVYLSGQTMGPYYGLFDRWYSKHCLNKVSMISFRDKSVSHERLISLGVNKPEMFDAADDAITLNGIDDAVAQKYLEAETGITFTELKKRPIIFVNLKGSLLLFKGKGREGTVDSETRLMAQIVDAIINKYDCNIVYFPTDFTPGVDDRVLHDESIKLVRNRRRVFKVDGEYSDIELIGMINCADVVIGGRYHFNVFAASCFKPFLGISSGEYQRTKLQGLANLCGIPECYINIDMEEAKLDDIWNSICYVIENREDISGVLRDRVPDLKKASNRVTEELVKYLKHRTQ